MKLGAYFFCQNERLNETIGISLLLLTFLTLNTDENETRSTISGGGVRGGVKGGDGEIDKKKVRPPKKTSTSSAAVFETDKRVDAKQQGNKEGKLIVGVQLK